MAQRWKLYVCRNCGKLPVAVQGGDTALGRVVVFVGFGKLNLCDDAYQKSQEQDVHYKGKRRPLLLPLFVASEMVEAFF